jgi:hypothetical protein
VEHVGQLDHLDQVAAVADPAFALRVVIVELGDLASERWRVRRGEGPHWQRWPFLLCSQRLGKGSDVPPRETRAFLLRVDLGANAGQRLQQVLVLAEDPYPFQHTADPIGQRLDLLIAE